MAQDGNLRDEEGHVLAPRTKAANVRTIDTHGSLGALNGVTNAQDLFDSLSLKTKTLIGDDANKSVRTIANEQIIATIIAPNPKASLDTLQEIADWIQQHPDDAAAMNSEINTLKNTTIPNLNTTLTNAINKRIPYHTGGGLGSCSGSGSYNYCKIATFKIKTTYANRPITMEVSGRGRHTSTIQIIFASANSQDPGISTFDTDYDTCFWLKKTATSTWALYFQYSETWGNCVLHRITGAGAEDVATITINMENVASVPSGSTQVYRPFKTQADIDAAVAAAMKGNAGVGDVLAGKTFTNASTSGLTGTMPNRGAASITLYPDHEGSTPSGQYTTYKSYTIPAGYHNGSGKVQITTQTKRVSSEANYYKWVKADFGKVLETVYIDPQVHSSTFVTSENKAKVDMGSDHDYRYVDTRNVYNNGYNAGNEAGTAAGYSSGYSAGKFDSGANGWSTEWSSNNNWMSTDTNNKGTITIYVNSNYSYIITYCTIGATNASTCYLEAPTLSDTSNFSLTQMYSTINTYSGHPNMHMYTCLVKPKNKASHSASVTTHYIGRCIVHENKVKVN